MSEVEAIQVLTKKGYQVLKLSDLKTVVAEMVASLGNDKRVRYISRTDAYAKYGVSKDWFLKYETHPETLLRVKPDGQKKLYLEQSIINEMERQCV